MPETMNESEARALIAAAGWKLCFVERRDSGYEGGIETNHPNPSSRYQEDYCCRRPRKQAVLARLVAVAEALGKGE